MSVETKFRTESPENIVDSLINKYFFWLISRPKDAFDIQGGIKGHAGNVQDLVDPMFSRVVAIQGLEREGKDRLTAKLGEVGSPEGKLRWMLNHLVSETPRNMP